MNFLSLIPCLLSILTITAQAELYTSVQDMTSVFALEQRLVGALKNYLTTTEDRLAKIRRYLTAYEQVAAEQVATEEGIVERLAGNPLHAFHLIKRMTVDWKHIEANVKNDTWRDVTKAMAGVEELPPRMPNEDDLHGAAQALVRLHDVYNLNMSQLVQGNIGGVQSFSELTAQDCLYMGKHSFNLGMYRRAVEWFEEAYVLAGKEYNATVSQGQITTFLNTAIRAHEEVSAASDIDKDKLLQLEDSNSGPSGDDSADVSITPKYKLGNNLTAWEDADNFQALCRGEKLRSEAYISSLSCYYDHRGEAYFYLMPTKVERLHHDPEILKFHHLLTDDEIFQIKEIAKPLVR